MPAVDAPDFELESRIHRAGYVAVAGLDEVGRGTLAGPVAAGAVILPKKPRRKLFNLVRDSKQMSAPQREEAYTLIIRSAQSCAVGWADASEIDRYGIVPSVRLAMRRALGRLAEPPEYLLIDALALPSTNLPQTSIVRGDSKSLSIAAASVIAKVERDRFMIDLAESYPGYGFESHKGYATQQHLEAIKELGQSPMHRMTFRPVAYAKDRLKRVHPSVAGEWAESFVVRDLIDRGMEILSRNYRTRFGEVDIVARDGTTLTIIEVRARRSTSFGSPAETISRAKARRITAACHEYLQRHKLTDADWRIDVAEVQLDRWSRPVSLEMIESAIEG